MNKSKERYAFGGYKYAPESFNFTLNGKIMNLPEELKQSLQYKAVCGNKDEVISELKRFVRKTRRNGNVAYVTYGFFGEGEKRYYYTRDLLAKPDELNERVRVYKEVKKSLQKAIDEAHIGFVCTTGEITPYGDKKMSEEKHLVRLDFSRPIKIKFVMPAVC